jgi:hypothetical protein
MVQEQVQLNGTLGPPKLRPVEERKRQVNGAGIQAHELIFETELLPDAVSGYCRLTFGQELLENGLIKRPRPVRIGIGESGTFRRIRNAQVLEFSFAAGQSPTDLTEAVGSAELAEKHGDELPPAAEPLCGVIGSVLLDGLFEFQSWEQLQELRENARKSWHGRASLDFIELRKSNLTQERFRPSHIIQP